MINDIYVDIIVNNLVYKKFLIIYILYNILSFSTNIKLFIFRCNNCTRILISISKKKLVVSDNDIILFYNSVDENYLV